LTMAYEILRGILGGIKGARERRRLEEEPVREEERLRAREILKAVMEGTIERAPTSEGTIFAPPERVAPQGIGQKIMEGFGIRQPQYERGQGYRRTPGKYQPTTREEALEFERAKTGLKPWKPQTREEQLKFERAKIGIKGEVEKKPTKFQLQKEAFDEAFRRLGGSYMVGLDEESKIEYENLGNQIYQEYLGQYGYTGKPEARPAMPRVRETGRVTVISPQGERGNIPANQLQEALRAGYRQVR